MTISIPSRRSLLKAASITTLASILAIGVNPGKASAIIEMFGASSVSSSYTPFPFNTDIGNVIDQSGLSTGYTNGQDQASYLASNPTHAAPFSGNEFTSNGTGGTSGTIDFDLGSVVNVANLVIWNDDFAGLQEFDILASLSSDFSSSTNLGSFIGLDRANGVNYPHDLYDFADINARYIRLDVQSSHDSSVVGLGEVAFGVEASAAVPFEFSPTLGILAVGGIFGISRLRKRSAKLDK